MSQGKANSGKSRRTEKLAADPAASAADAGNTQKISLHGLESSVPSFRFDRGISGNRKRANAEVGLVATEGDKKKTSEKKKKRKNDQSQTSRRTHPSQSKTSKRKQSKAEANKAKKYVRADPITKEELKEVTSLRLKRGLKQQSDAAKAAADAAARAEILLPSEAGFLEPDPESITRTWQIKQQALKPHLDRRSAKKIFSLDLPTYGPYKLDYTQNGRWLLLAGRRGHTVLMDWMEMKLSTELQLRETVRDVKFLHDHTMFAVAQKKYTYIYDNQGIELHVLRNHVDVNALEFLPYHFLLCSVGKTGYLRLQDTSTGQLVAEHRTKLGDCRVLRQNPRNAVLHLGHSNGTVTLWSPNMTTPLVKMLTHKAPVQALAVDRDGNYMVTSGLDGQVKVWDVRTYKLVHSYFSIRPATTLDISHRGLLAVGNGPHVQVWQDALRTKQKAPYMTELLPAQGVERVRFVPYEDLLGVGHTSGFKSMVVPGSGEPNFDTFEANPFETLKQRRERVVHTLLEKLKPELIGLDGGASFGVLSGRAKAIFDQDRHAMRKAEAEKKAKEDALNLSKKARGKNKPSRRTKRKRANIMDLRKQEWQTTQTKQMAEKKKKERDAERQAKGQGKSALDRFE
eukprot:gb/GEZN01003686.1/.p1 GENE.gb/GEZN01003686.1/~~gb/GEZN01003686.1/.p1  ORF type:complete len:626 (-),score=104.09 gb/GEZN01003686.1/:169-2046(-)